MRRTSGITPQDQEPRTSTDYKMDPKVVNANTLTPKATLEDLAEKFSQKNGTPAHYIIANKALKDDLIDFLNSKFDCMQQEIIQLKNEIIKSRETKSKLLKVIEEMKVNQIPKEPNLKDDFYIIGSSILREVRSDDAVNGTVKNISGGKIKDIKQEIESLTIKPRTIVPQIGGNDVDSAGSSVEDVVSEYVMTLTDTKAKYPDTKLVVAGLPPRHNSTETRTKVKDYNDEMNKWCKANSVEFINNESMFEFKTGEVEPHSIL